MGIYFYESLISCVYPLLPFTFKDTSSDLVDICSGSSMSFRFNKDTTVDFQWFLNSLYFSHYVKGEDQWWQDSNPQSKLSKSGQLRNRLSMCALNTIRKCSILTRFLNFYNLHTIKCTHTEMIELDTCKIFKWYHML